MKKQFLAVCLLMLACLSFSFTEKKTIEPIANVQSMEHVQPHIFVLMGATGDLAHKKLFPALFNLFHNGDLPKNFVMVGSAISPLTQEEFHQKIRQSLEANLPAKLKDPKLWQEFINKFYYQKLDFANAADYEKLKLFLDEKDKQFQTQGNRIFYLAIPPSFFPKVNQNLNDQKLMVRANKLEKSWSRIVIEKPFGHDLDSAVALQKHITNDFDSSQIYLIDHFLGKEVVQNLLPLRLSNPLFSKLWNRQGIDNVQITFSENIGIGTRGKFWEETGLLRDIIQNHLMQLLALIAMEPPTSLQADDIRAQKLKAVEAIRPFTLEDIEKQIVRGQYGSGMVDGKKAVGYRQEKDVPADSNVETFVAAKLMIDNERWQGVPFYLRAGKRLDKNLVEIVVTFKEDPTALLSGNESKKYSPNKLVIRVQPDPEIYLQFNTKLPGLHGEVKTLKMSFNYHNSLGVRIPDAYETLFYESMLGNSSLFVSIGEILASWRLYTPILSKWQAELPMNSFPNYPAGSFGPSNADHLLEKGNTWHGDPSTPHKIFHTNEMPSPQRKAA